MWVAAAPPPKLFVVTRPAASPRRLAIRVRAVAEEDSRQILHFDPPEAETPNVPEGRALGPGNWQQTLWKSFSLEGIGLHTGETACVKVKPAFAGEGRYFVRVPLGTNTPQHRYEEEDFPEEEMYPNPFAGENVAENEQVEDERVELFLDYMKAQQRDGYEGSFEDYGILKDKVNVVERAPIREDVQRRSEEDKFVIANIENVSVEDHGLSTDLVSENCKVESVEHILSALEACGIDNARIEIEGGPEVPVADGSAFPWAEMIRRSGLTPALTSMDGRIARVRRAAYRFEEQLMLCDGDSWMMLVPGDTMKVSYGLDYPVQAIGKQWHSWCQQDWVDEYILTLAPARSFAQSQEALYEMRDAGLLKAGAEGVVLVATGKGWMQEDLIQYSNEPARHKVTDLIGDLSLLSLGGMSGLPYGHITAYNADHKMHIKFIKLLKESMGEKYYDGYIPNPKVPS